jgi:transposase-like protein
MTENENPPEGLAGSVSAETELTTDQARELTDQIRAAVTDLWELVIRAHRQRIWVVLKYSTWAEYCEKELSRIPQRRISHDERIEIVAGLRKSGMSIRAIASATGTGTRQVQEALSDQVCSETTPEIIVGTDGKKQPAKRTKRQLLLARTKSPHEGRSRKDESPSPGTGFRRR